MRDRELRLIVLRKYYEKREEEDFIPVNKEYFGDEIAKSTVLRISEQLHQQGLIDFKPLRGADQLLAGFGRITARGIDVVEEETPQPSKRVEASPKVFLSYAREDGLAARKLFYDLGQAGVEVWFDEESLLGGQNWKLAIRRAIKGCRFFIALLSTKSISKKGYVQKELKEALEVLDEYPPSQIFLIPVRLDDCHPTDMQLHDIQWIDMFPSWDDGLARILRAVRSQME
jgi:hypothetical protein